MPNMTTSSSLNNAYRLCSAVAMTVTLCACGGGSSEPESAANIDTAARDEALKRKAPAPAPAPDPDPDPMIIANCGIPSFSEAALARINEYRAQGAGCGSAGNFAATTPLAWHAQLIAAATRHSTDMAKNNFMSHTGSDGSDGYDRILDAGYVPYYWGENILSGLSTIQATVDWWMSSPGHCANIMKSRFKDVGLACVKSAATNKMYWTLDLGEHR